MPRRRRGRPHLEWSAVQGMPAQACISPNPLQLETETQPEARWRSPPPTRRMAWECHLGATHRPGIASRRPPSREPPVSSPTATNRQSGAPAACALRRAPGKRGCSRSRPAPRRVVDVEGGRDRATRTVRRRARPGREGTEERVLARRWNGRYDLAAARPAEDRIRPNE